MAQYCSACYPAKIRSHKGTYFFDLIDHFLDFFLPRRPARQLPRFPAWLSLNHEFYRLMWLLRVVRFKREYNKEEHWPRSYVVLEEARRRSIPVDTISILGRTTPYYCARFGSKRYYFDALPSRFLNFRLDDKGFVKKQLNKNGFPVAEGRSFWSVKRARRYGKKLGFPLVVKPARGTHAYHVSVDIQTEQELYDAIKLAKQYQPSFIVERYLPNSLYRVTVINFNKVFVARREAPNVVGDGKSSIKELVEKKNADPRRGETGQKDTTLHKIPINKMTKQALGKVGLTLDTVPLIGQKVVLHSKASIGSGGDIVEETLDLHAENKEMFRRAARLFGTDLVGFDVIAEDLSRPYTKQECGIIEANSIPMLDFHHNPCIGEPQNAAAALWDAILADKRVRYMHPVMLPERSLYTRFIWHLLDMVMPFIRDFLLGFHIVRKISIRQRFPAGWLRPEIAPETAITYLKLHGFEVVRPEWIDYGEIAGLRKLLSAEQQCHIRFFNDGEIRAHVEYAPEARPIAHLLERDFHSARDIVYEFLHQYLEERKPRKRKSKLLEKIEKIRKQGKKWTKL